MDTSANSSSNIASDASKNKTDVITTSSNEKSSPLPQTAVTADSIKKNSVSDSTKTAFDSIFNQPNIIMGLSFLAMYFIIYYLTSIFVNSGTSDNGVDSQRILSRVIDIFALIIIIAGVFYYYTSLNEYDKSHLLSYMYDMSVAFYTSSVTFISLIMTIVIFYILLYVGRVPMTVDTKPFLVAFLEQKLWFLLITVGIINFMIYFLNIPIVDMLTNQYVDIMKYFDSNYIDVSLKKSSDYDYDISINMIHESPTPSVVPVVTPPVISTNEVFNVSNNLYTYDDAQAICKSYDATMATYDQVESAYNNGGEWCNYGWSDNQMALFPTQKNTWNALQKTPEHKNDCGRPGVNGGFIENPYSKFGVNCFGKKPLATEDDKAKQLKNQTQIHPKTADDILLDSKVEYWKKNGDKMLILNSFNNKTWSEY